ncbi:hypothetical protein CRE_23399 [Caenorhabditis remanei]|uniref:DUF38 domain-containing protein n=1 Tax=Caenorhabditis remanei TaxID=31234 RepID=E3MGL2_CAERE|nr:hypothetical protein CRE_23399 [Caenorhabditis remanei]
MTTSFPDFLQKLTPSLAIKSIRFAASPDALSFRASYGEGKDHVEKEYNSLSNFKKEMDKVWSRFSPESVPQLDISVGDPDENQNQLFLKYIREKLKALKSPLQVNIFIMRSVKEKEVMEVLQLLDPDSVAVIRISKPDTDNRNCQNLFGVRQISKLPQWKNAKGVIIMGLKMEAELSAFFHCENVKINVEKVTLDGFCELKETFFTKNHMRTFEVHFTEFENAELYFQSMFKTPANKTKDRTEWNIQMAYSLARITVVLTDAKFMMTKVSANDDEEDEDS